MYPWHQCSVLKHNKTSELSVLTDRSSPHRHFRAKSFFHYTLVFRSPSKNSHLGRSWNLNHPLITKPFNQVGKMTKQTRNLLYAIWKFNSVHSPTYVICESKVNEPLAKGTITPRKNSRF